MYAFFFIYYCCRIFELSLTLSWAVIKSAQLNNTYLLIQIIGIHLFRRSLHFIQKKTHRNFWFAGMLFTEGSKLF